MPMSLQVYPMRLLIVCLVLVGLAVHAHAADYSPINEPVLRGSDVPPPGPAFVPGYPIYTRWQGLYLGGQMGRSMAGVDYGGGVSSLLSYILRNDVVLDHVINWTTLPKDDTTGASYGAFIGYNWQWDGDAVVGVELNYNRTGLRSSAADGLSRSFQDDAVAPAQHQFF
jgi:hypothetical protein